MSLRVGLWEEQLPTGAELFLMEVEQLPMGVELLLTGEELHPMEVELFPMEEGHLLLLLLLRMEVGVAEVPREVEPRQVVAAFQSPQPQAGFSS